MAIKILITGPESTGKSTLTSNLSAYFSFNHGLKTKAIQEFAREWIDNELGGDMDKLEFEHITLFGTKQMELVEEAEKENYDLIFSDTDALVSTIFQNIYFEKIDDKLVETVKKEKWDLILLLHPDVPWVNDGQRNLGNKRNEVLEYFKFSLDLVGMKWVDVKGNWDERMKIAVDAVSEILKKDVQRA